MKENLMLSVVIPIYKVEAYLKECVDSVLDQTYRNLEVILVDDGSPDKCPQICDEYAKRDSRVRVIHKPNGGLSDARNEGLKAAMGDYIIFLDSDDYYAQTDFLETVVKVTASGSKDAVFFQRTVFYDGQDRPNDDLPPYQMEWNKLTANNLLLELAINDRLDASACMKATKRSILLDNELYFKKGIYCEDIEWFSRYVMFIYSVALLNKPDYFYRKRSGSITASLTEKNVRDLFYTIKTHSMAIRDSKVDANRISAILSYHSYQYYIILGLTNNYVSGNARRQLLKECKAYKWLASYSLSKKTKKSGIVLKMLGVNMASKIFGYYIKNK